MGTGFVSRMSMIRYSHAAAAVARAGLAALLVALAACTRSDPPNAPPAIRHADFGAEQPGTEVRRIADWVADSGDNAGMAFLVIDKVAARAYAFGPDGTLAGAAPVLLGLARGDDTAPGVGDKPLSAVRRDERTTAAGRFVAEIGYNLRGEDVLWVDYDSGLSLHRVRTANPRERRAERLATPTPADNRVSYGCINVPVDFFEQVIRPAYRGTQGVVYVLPETRPALAMFGAYDVDEHGGRAAQRHATVRLTERRAEAAGSGAHK
jgi:hypothetical protein